MKKTLSILLFSLISLAMVAQKEVTQKLEKFNEIKAFDRIAVRLIKSGENKIVITGDDSDEVSIANKNGLLKVRMEFDNHMDGGDIEAKVYYTENLTLIDSNENAKITSDDTLKADKVKITVQEGGKVSLHIEVDQLDVKSTSGGEITLTGTTNTQIVVANAGGKVYNEKLDTKNTNVTVNAGGTADIKASEKVNAKVRAGGSITIYGHPKEVEKNKVFGGKIKIID